MTRDQIAELLALGHVFGAAAVAERVDTVERLIAEAVAAERERVIAITADFACFGPAGLAELRKRCAP